MKLFKIALALFTIALLFNGCAKEYSVETGGLKLPVGNWEFKNGTTSYAGNMDTAYIAPAGATKQLHLDGTSTDGTQNFHMVLYADSFPVGTYKASLFQSTFDYTATAKTIYEASQLIGEFTVNITSINSSLIVGTFSGTAKDSANNLKQLTAGKFKATFGNGNVPTSTGVLGDSSGNCKPVILNGTYTQGITSTAANTVQIQVTVALAGTYSISTNTVNGVSFSNIGTFTNTGVQNVTLNATGTPSLSGTQAFTLKYGNSQCAFTINFLPGVTASGDYFPITVNSNWTFGAVNSTAPDSFMLKVISFTKTINSNVYQAIGSYHLPPANAYDTNYVRKPGGDYYAYGDFGTLLHFDQPAFLEYIFLKDNVAAGTTWTSSTLNGTISGVPVSAYVQSTILQKAVPVTIGIFNFPDVIKVKNDVYLNAVLVQTTETWYAKNVGEIYTTVGSTIYQISGYQIF